MDALIFAGLAALILGAGLMIYRQGVRARRRFAEHVARHGFTPWVDVPSLEIDSRKLMLWQGFSGAFAPGLNGFLICGYIAKPSERGSYTNYIVAQLSAHPSLGDDAVARLSEADEVQRTQDGGVVVAWQAMDTPAEAEKIFSKISAALAKA